MTTSGGSAIGISSSANTAPVGGKVASTGGIVGMKGITNSLIDSFTEVVEEEK
jgi:hypothetical protein